MPITIEHIDAIARKKGRDVLFVRFHHPTTATASNANIPFDWRNDPIRRNFIDWLEQNQIGWELCADIAQDGCFESYRGQIYIDLPFDMNDLQCQKLCEYLEYPDGRIRFDTMSFICLGIEAAKKNAHHDQPGYWEKFFADEEELS